MTMSAAEEERCRELLAKLKDAIDKRGVLLDKLGKVMEETVSSLTVSTPLLVHGAADWTPNSTATNKVPAMTNVAPSANATLTDQAHTRCSRSGLDTNAGDLHVVAASNPETGVLTVAPAPAEHSSVPSSKPFSTTQQDTMTPTKCLTLGLDSNTGSIHVPATSLLTMAAFMAVRAPKGSSSLPMVVVPAPTRVACGMIMKFGLCKFNEKAIDRVVLNGVPLLILGLGKIEEFLGTVVRLQPWPPPASPNCRDLLVKVDKVLGHVVDITLRWVVLQPPWPPPNLTAQIKMSYDDQVSDGSSIAPEFALSGWSYAIEPVGITKENALTKPGLMEQIKREISIMRLVKHPNVLQLFEIIASKSKIYFVLEYAKGGELFNKIAKGGKLSEDAARRYFHQLISAVDYCHSRGVYHRDLKPENLLLDENENLRVSDFGLSALAESKRQDGLLHTTCGTPAYVAPEVLSRKGYDGAKADIWSCGVILFVLVAGYLPFHDTNLMEMYRKISKADFRCPRYFSAELKELLHKILDSDPSTRISISRIKRSAWYRRPVEVNAKKNETETTDNTCSGEATTSGSTECSTSEGNQGSLSLPNLNAFDIISLSTGFNLSGFFEDKYGRREERFTTRQPVTTVLTKLKELGKRLKLKVKKKENGVLELAAPKEGKKGFLELDAEIFEVAPSFLLVELKKTNGDTMEYQKLVKEEIRPALKDIVWVWQGDQHQHSQPILQGEQQQSPLPPQQPQDQLPPQQPQDQLPPQQPQDQLQPSLPRQEPQDMSEPPLPPQELQDQLQPPIPPDHLKS